MTEAEAAYIAGFFDGEGTVVLTHKRGQRVTRINVSQKVPDTLFWIQGLLGFGAISRRNQTGNYNLRFDKHAEQLAFINLVLPYAQLKRKKMLVARAFILQSAGIGHRMSPEQRQRRQELARLFDRLRSAA